MYSEILAETVGKCPSILRKIRDMEHKRCLGGNKRIAGKKYTAGKEAGPQIESIFSNNRECLGGFILKSSNIFIVNIMTKHNNLCIYDRKRSGARMVS